MDRTPTPKSLLVPPNRIAELKGEAVRLPSWDLAPHHVHDLELLLNGGFSPLAGFLGRADYESVCHEMRLQDGTLWPMPVQLDVTEAFAATVQAGSRVALRHPEGMVLALLTVADKWVPDRRREARDVFGTEDERHPGVFRLLHQTNGTYLGGTLEGLELPPHHTFRELRHTPGELRAEFGRRGWKRVVAFQTRNPMHRAHVELTRRAMRDADAALLVHPVVGRTSPGDLDYFVRVRAYKAVLGHYPTHAVQLSILPLAMRMGGPREALWHALIRKNYGATHFIVGRDHASPGNGSNGQPFYDPYAAQRLVGEHEKELGIAMMPYEEMVYVEDLDGYRATSEVPAGASVGKLSGTELRRLLREGREVPTWFSFPEVVRELRKVHPPRGEMGFTVFFTGLSGAGKSTIAQILVAKLMEEGDRPVTLLDGDIVRKNLSSELGFSREHRDLNIRRIGFVAGEITKNGGVAVCAPIAPYAATRREVREMIGAQGGFVEVYVRAPLEVCEARDRKGLYAKARAGLLPNFTGISDPYEAPTNPEVLVDTTTNSPEVGASIILGHLRKEGYIGQTG